MVLYHANGRVVIAHENYLEQQARKDATEKRYIDQIDVYRQREAAPSPRGVEIIIDRQEYRTLYCEKSNGWGSDFEWLDAFEQLEAETITLPDTVNRRTLMLCSSLAHEYFTYNPGAHDLHLPVCYPRIHVAGQGNKLREVFESDWGDLVLVHDKRLLRVSDEQMAYLRSHEMKMYIVPWLAKVQEQIERAEKRNVKMKGGAEPEAGKPVGKIAEEKKPSNYLVKGDGPIAMEFPADLLEKIHLYNAMLQLGLPKFVQLPLIDALVLEMYQTNLTACHLAHLEMTVGRFYSRGVAVLDPVLNHLVGTYSFRTLEDRRCQGSMTSLKNQAS
jgi:hypothetical protein